MTPSQIPPLPFWAENADYICDAALRRYPDFADPHACREWLLAIHIAFAINAAERVFTMSAGDTDPPWIDNEARNVPAIIFANIFDVYAQVGVDKDKALVDRTARTIRDVFAKRLGELCRSAPTFRGCA